MITGRDRVGLYIFISTFVVLGGGTSPGERKLAFCGTYWPTDVVKISCYKKDTRVDLGALTGFPKLQRLELDGVKIENVRLFVNIRNIKVLALQNVETPGIDFIAGAESLEKLYLDGTKVKESDVAKLRLKDLRTLSLVDTGITGLNIFNGKRSVEVLILDENRISEFTSLRELKKLKELSIAGTEMRSIGSISFLQHLSVLNVSRTKINNLHGIEKMDRLETFVADHTNLDSLVPFDNRADMQMISFKGAFIRKYDKLRRIKRITLRADFSESNIEGVEFLSGIEKIVELDLSSTSLESIEAISGVDIRYLDISNTRVMKVDKLGKNMVGLNMNNCPINDIKFVEKLGKIEDLEIDGTNIRDLSPLIALRNIKGLSMEGVKMDPSVIQKILENNVNLDAINVDDSVISRRH